MGRTKAQENTEAIERFRQIIDNLGVVMSNDAIWHLYNWRFDEKDIGNRRFLQEYLGLIKMYPMNEKNKVMIRELLKQFNEEAGKMETAEWLEKAQEKGIEILESELSVLWNMGYTEEERRNEKKKKVESESSEEEDEIDKIIASVYELLLETKNELTKADISRILRLGFDQYEIVIDGFVKEYKSVREKDDKEVYRILHSHLANRGLIWNRDEEDTDESDPQREPGKENSGESETTSEEEEKSSDESEKLINTPGKSPSELSDSKQEKEENKKETTIPIVPITLIPITMANINQIQNVLRTFGATMLGHDIGNDWTNPIAPPIILTGLQGEIQTVEGSWFSGSFF
ncbi:hypothetical protein GLOIN_2v1875885 [Rhizophagus irregularis DAOM 181602=DAOM 197198]|uniref:Uncharacterized protein n=1 Tax=Rhizophagus irregularis (strain DAOM 181602 / DAOM 197198 / MUCL 43194) TaxID=747089 RepID=A0A2P4Q1F3_RHIID|nr:hypothetical protein GLOIN_2v1875885 [Rhizophagus irregularis DAOM 181602=DAOM 197198]POG71463.1 hypothetical protein GLOIN_2v1875885 [Rhizophagus irregularis DAOM 181602=DAOM 197198]|eukprot:XP_025178329.1 hypothetical protein GLOIN_2v1875885 [Rhizophagus irregularis DAOM 181602=DAOM 197198]